MKRLHLHVGVKDLEKAVHFYSALFGTPPVKMKPDYAKWMLDNPRVNFAVSTRTGETGVDHLGIQVDGEGELFEIRTRLKDAGVGLMMEGESDCCYARSEKSWVHDPAGIPWEAYRTMEEIDTFKNGKSLESVCCSPQVDSNSCCAPPSDLGRFEE